MKIGDKMKKILMIDDDKDILEINKKYFKEQGYKVYTAINGQKGLEIIKQVHIDCVILDIVLEQEDGFYFAREIKEIDNVPVIFLTCLQDDETIIKAFSNGEEYIKKPYLLKELQIRVENRLSKKIKSILDFNPLVIDILSRKVMINNMVIPLTNYEFDILLLLANNENEVFTIGQVYQKLWQLPDNQNTKTVQVHIAHLRKKLESAYPRHCFIETIWGRGYVFKKESR